MSRIIRIIGDIDSSAFETFSEELKEFEKTPNKPVYIELNSGGGFATDALGFAARMRLSPCELIVTAYGLVASAAVIILASGDYSRMTYESWVMVHEDQVEDFSGSVSQIEAKAKQDRRMENQWAALLASMTPMTSKDQWLEMHKNETWLNANECLRLSLIDEIV